MGANPSDGNPTSGNRGSDINHLHGDRPDDWSSTDELIDSLFDQVNQPSRPTKHKLESGQIPQAIGPYSVDKLLGEGGFGSVYLAYDTQLKRHVAIKVASTGHADLLQDAQKAAGLKHDRIVTVHGIETSSDGSFFVVMEYLEGGSLADRIDVDERMSCEEAVSMVADVAEALQHAHEQGIVHRDLKPANILLDHQGRPHIADFGLALSGPQATDLPGKICGTAKYMAPEQIPGGTGEVSARSDIWSLGIILHEILTGNVPFHGQTRDMVFKNILECSPKPPRQVNPRIPRELQKVVLRCLEKAPDRRYRSAAALAEALRCSLHPSTRLEGSAAADRVEPGLRLSVIKGRFTILGCLASIGILLAAWLAIDWRNRPESNAASAPSTASERQAKTLEHQIKRFDYAGIIQGAYRAWKNADVASANKLLSQAIPLHGDNDFRDFEWYYLHRLCEGGKKTWRAHAGGVYGVAYSVDGKRLASCGEDGAVRIWDSATGELIHQFQGDSQPIYAVAYSPDGQIIAAGGKDARIRLFHGEALESFEVLSGHTDEVTYLAFSPDSQVLASASEDTTVRLWDADTGEGLACLRDHRHTVHTLAFSPDGKMLFSGSEDHSVKMWKLESLAKPFDQFDQIEGKGIGRVYSVASHPKGRILAVTSETIIQFLDLVNGRLTQLPLEHRNTVQSVVFSPNGQLFASAGYDQRIILWDTKRCSVQQVYHGHENRIFQLAYSPQGNFLASASRDGMVKIWDTTGPQDRQRVPTDVRGKLVDLVFSPDGSMLVGLTQEPEQSRLLTWDFPSMSQTMVSKFSARMPTTAIAFFLNRCRYALCAYQGKVEFFDSRHSLPYQTFQHPFQQLSDIAIAPDEKSYAVITEEGDSGKLLDMATGEKLADLPGQRTVAFSPDGALVAFESTKIQGAVELWDQKKVIIITTLPGCEGEIYEIVFSREGHYLATARSDGTTMIWDVVQAREYQTFQAHIGGVRDVAFHPDGKRIATAGRDGFVVLWDVDTGVPLLRLPVAPNGSVETIAFSPDGTILATGSTDGTKAYLDLWHAPVLGFELR